VPSVDLNSDVGEGFGAWMGGPDDQLAPMLTSVNVACGAYAGDPSTIRRTCELAQRHGCVIGGQVGYPDLLGFGRRFIDMQPDDLTDSVVHQLGGLQSFAALVGRRVRYVKPHGALYHAMVTHDAQAAAVIRAVVAFDPTMAVLGMPGSAVEAVCADAGVRFVIEGFADRNYRADGKLVARTEPGALITDPSVAARQAVQLARSGIESICVHSDTPGAPDIVAAVAGELATAGFDVRSFTS
jgi:UPF0271 protein